MVVSSMSGAMKDTRARAVEGMTLPAITQLVSAKTSLPMMVCCFGMPLATKQNILTVSQTMRWK